MALDTQEGIYLTSGLYTWKRYYAGEIAPEWFGAVGDVSATDKR